MIKNDYRRLLVWQRGQELFNIVYRATSKYPRAEQFRLVDQMRRASSSIISNIAEGSNRNTLAHKRKYISDAYGSALELETQIEASFSQQYLNTTEFNELGIAMKHVLRLLNCYYKKPL